MHFVEYNVSNRISKKKKKEKRKRNQRFGLYETFSESRVLKLQRDSTSAIIMKKKFRKGMKKLQTNRIKMFFF